MKIEVTEASTFKPLKLELTLETQEEVDAIKALSRLDVTVPKCVDERMGPIYSGLRLFCNRLYAVLK